MDDPEDNGAIPIDRYQERFEKIDEDSQKHQSDIDALNGLIANMRTEYLSQLFQFGQRQLNTDRELALHVVLDQSRWAYYYLVQLHNPNDQDTTFPNRVAACIIGIHAEKARFEERIRQSTQALADVYQFTQALNSLFQRNLMAVTV